MNYLSDPIKIGAVQLKNRIIMAPLTRCRCEPGAVPAKIMAAYYCQRASAGLIIAEATAVSPMSIGYPNTPGIWSEAQINAWREVTRAVHLKGGKIFLQLWHVGRMSDPCYLDGALPVAPSAIKPDGYISLIRPKRQFVTPRALALSEIPDIVEAFRKAAENALVAGFDGVEIHGANGYLLNQFFNPGSNQRTDRYGGTVENRSRLMLEVLDAVILVYGAGRVGLHISPQDDEHSMLQQEPALALADYSYLMQEVSKRKIAFVFSREAAHFPNRLGPELKKIFDGVYIANEDFTQQSAEQAIAAGEADAVAFGRSFISNPDLPLRFERNAELNETDADRYYYAPVEQGYTDYPTLS